MANHASSKTWTDPCLPASSRPADEARRRALTLLAPAGSIVGARVLARGCKSWLFARADADEGLDFVARYFRVQHALGVSSGRAALAVILKALRSMRPECEIVAVPAYTCFSVAAAVVRLGLKIYPIEVDSRTLDCDYAKLAGLPSRGLLCIVTSNLFGFVNNAERLREIARDKGAFLVDDIAQSLGASRKGKLSGSIADVSFFSLGRGKPLPAGEGGVVVTDSGEIARAVREQLAQFRAATRRQDAGAFAKVLATAIFLNRYLYRIPDSLPFLKLGATPFEPGFPMKGLPCFSRSLALELLGTLPELNDGRRERAAWITRAIAGNDGFIAPLPAPGCNPTYLRFPLLARNRELRDLAVKELRRAGIGATPFYPSALCDIPGIGKWMATPDHHRPRAENLAARLLTLPTHSQVRKDDTVRLASLLSHLAKAA